MKIAFAIIIFNFYSSGNFHNSEDRNSFKPTDNRNNNMFFII